MTNAPSTGHSAKILSVGALPLDTEGLPFATFKACFLRIHTLCEREILPSPEMVFLNRAGLFHYIDPAWIPDVPQVALAVELIIRATTLAELTGEGDGNPGTSSMPRYVVKPGHYRRLRNVDGNSMRAIMGEIQAFKRPITRADHLQLLEWFKILAGFFLFVRPTGGKIALKHLTWEEQNRFVMALIGGVGEIFLTHCMALVKQTINDGRKVDPNDLYDMLQLILLEDNNSLFVTSEKSFFRYQTSHNQSQRILHWKAFLDSAAHGDV